MINIETYSNKKNILLNIGRKLTKENLIDKFYIIETYKEENDKSLKEYELKFISDFLNYDKIEKIIKENHNYKNPLIIYYDINVSKESK